MVKRGVVRLERRYNGEWDELCVASEEYCKGYWDAQTGFGWDRAWHRIRRSDGTLITWKDRERDGEVPR